MNEPMEAAPDVAKQQTQRKPYVPPQLTLFGQVAALTQGTACSNNNDSGCAAGGTSMGKVTSDRRLKQDIVRIGQHPAGFGLYLFTYKPEVATRCGEGRRFGVMAHEVEQVRPDAVFTDDLGFKSVRYDLLGIRLQ